MSLLLDAERGHDAAAPLGVRTDRPPRLFIVDRVDLRAQVDGGGDLVAFDPPAPQYAGRPPTKPRTLVAGRDLRRPQPTIFNGIASLKLTSDPLGSPNPE
jgi:hypothetical protein